ncbi:ribosome maturation factor RimP [Caenispirillum bisanense]|uniref:Ribosome maturation factor RimP n=1 Tax=Caenispirillum bisanense TaxID=414052 RepID=A0A286G968_9PROT|nr:ribosome maturation factor RimP [Caenispirillum bisanense]SOD92035.1 ribosome maturation factor RimP [Caenispirillum bisanense]
MDLTTRIADLIEPTLDDMGYELVRVQLFGGQRQTLQIMAERKDGGMGIEDCSAISHAVSAILDVEDPIAGAYHLEVSSPGLDRPLTRAKDFDVWAGFDAKVELAQPHDGRKRFSGQLLGRDPETDEVKLRLVETDEEVSIPRHAIGKAKLVLNDALLAWAKAQQDEEEAGETDAAADNDDN